MSRYHDAGTSTRALAHDEWLKWLEGCAARWAALGNAAQANRVLSLRQRNLLAGTCSVCTYHNRPAKTVSDLAHDRRDAEREDDDRREEARDARARGEE